jgi:uncharacterized Zn-finger protein
MNGHIESVHEGKKPFKCNICDVTFFQKGDLTKHGKTVHEGKKPHKCNGCDKAFSQKGSLNPFMKKRSHSNVMIVI